MAFATATINSPTPAKDLMAALRTPLAAGGLTFVETYGTPPNANWLSVAYGAGLFAAIANNTATVATSPDGITWTQRFLPTSTAWQAVTFGNGLFVAVATGVAVAATSPDGITWTVRSLPSAANWSAVGYGNGVFVVVAGASSNAAATSPDGITWTARTLPLAASWGSVVYGNGVFVVFNASNGNVMLTSPDGITWTQRFMPASTTWQAVAFGNGMFAAVGFGSTIAASSPDGITWTQRVLPASANWVSVTHGNGVFVAVAGSSTIAASSTDGISWTQRVLPVSTAWVSVAYGGGVYATVATGTSIAASSPDGVTWTQRVLTTVSSSGIADVYKSPAASNQFGQDWYLILRRVGDFGAALFYQVAEGYNSTTHRATNYGGTGAAVTPTATTYVNPAAAAAPENICASAAQVSLAPTAVPFTYWVSATADRVVVGVKTSVETGFYAGLYDDLLPAGTTQFPLVCCLIFSGVTAQSAQYAIGYGSSNLWGGFTREPLQVASLGQNFEAVIHNGYMRVISTLAVGGFTPNTSTTTLYGNTCSAARVMIGTGRTSLNLGDGLRGLLIGCVCSQLNSVIGDTLTSGGKTYVRMAGPTTTFGIFADQGI